MPHMTQQAERKGCFRGILQLIAMSLAKPKEPHRLHQHVQMMHLQVNLPTTSGKARKHFKRCDLGYFDCR